MISRRKLLRAATAGFCLCNSFTPSFAADHVTVFAAASLKNALDAVGQAWQQETQNQIVVSYAATSALAKQIQEGAPADLFISADTDWMKKLVDAKAINPTSVVNLLGNSLVLVAPQNSKATIQIDKGFDLAGLIGEGKLALADVKSVPAGKYARAALESLAVWPSVESKVAMAENVRAALKLVATGEAAAGIVYTTDAKAEKTVKVLGTFPAESHPAIIYPMGQLSTSTNADAAAFETFLKGPKAKAIFEVQGFTVLVQPAI